MEDAFKLLKISFTEDPDTLLSASKAMRYKPLPTFHLLLSSIMGIAGNRPEARQYQEYNHKAVHLTSHAMKTTFINTAALLLKHHPELADEIHKTEWLKKYLNNGPVARLDEQQRNIRMLSLLLIDPPYMMQLRKRGLMQWDDGSMQAALVMAYGWRKTLDKKVKLLVGKQRAQKLAVMLLNDVLKENTTHTNLRITKDRFRLAWTNLSKEGITEVKSNFETLKSSENDKAIQLIATSSLIDLGIRYKKPELLHDNVINIKNLLKVDASHPVVKTVENWASIFDNNGAKPGITELKKFKASPGKYSFQAMRMLKILNENQSN